MEAHKMKKCVIKLNRIPYENIDDHIRDQIQVRRCFVRLHRLDCTKTPSLAPPTLHQTRRLRVRLQRLNFNGSRSDISSTASVISGHIFSDDDDDANGPANQTV